MPAFLVCSGFLFYLATTVPKGGRRGRGEQIGRIQKAAKKSHKGIWSGSTSPHRMKATCLGSHPTNAVAVVVVGGLAFTCLLLRPHPTATQDLNRVWDLHHSSRQHRIPHPLSEARDRTHILMDASWIHFRWATRGTPTNQRVLMRRDYELQPHFSCYLWTYYYILLTALVWAQIHGKE